MFRDSINGDRVVGPIMVPGGFNMIEARLLPFPKSGLGYIARWHTTVTSKDSSIHSWKRSLPLCKCYPSIPRLFCYKRLKVGGVSAFRTSTLSIICCSSFDKLSMAMDINLRRNISYSRPLKLQQRQSNLIRQEFDRFHEYMLFGFIRENIAHVAK